MVYIDISESGINRNLSILFLHHEKEHLKLCEELFINFKII